MDTKAQHVMIGKLLANALGLTVSNLERCPFIILTSIRGTEHATKKMKKPVRLIFRVGVEPSYYF